MRKKAMKNSFFCYTPAFLVIVIIIIIVNLHIHTNSNQQNTHIIPIWETESKHTKKDKRLVLFHFCTIQQSVK